MQLQQSNTEYKDLPSETYTMLLKKCYNNIYETNKKMLPNNIYSANNE